MTASGDAISGAAFDRADNPNACVAVRTAVQVITTGGGGQLISFDTEEFDNSNMFTPTSTNITIQSDGLYLVAFYLEFAANATGIRAADIIVNGTGETGITISLASAALTTRMTATNTFLLAPSDVLTFLAFQNSGGSINAIAARAAVIRVSG